MYKEKEKSVLKKVLLVGIFDTDTVSLAPHILRAYVEQFEISSKFEITTKEFSIYTHSLESMVRGIIEESPDVVGFSAYIWNIYEILEIVKSIDATIILGGPQVVGSEEELIRNNPNIDIIVTGEGEVAFKEFLEYLIGEKEIEEIHSLTTRDLKTERRTEVTDLSSIPPIYSRIFQEYPDIKWISLETSRGCPMKCGFCAWANNKKMRYYPLERVKENLNAILNQDTIEHIYICDSSLLLNKRRAKLILEYIISSGTGKTIRYEFDAEQLDDELIDLLAQLPHHEFNFGIQSINKGALISMGRTFNRTKFEEIYNKIIRRFKAPNITVDLIYGLPGDNIEGYKKSLDFAISLDKVTKIITNALIVLPGSEFYREMDKYGIALRDKKSHLAKKSSTFSQEEIELAKKYSFFVYTVYLNYRLRDCIKSFAQWQKKEYLQTITEFMKLLPPDIIKEPYPDVVSTLKEYYKLRNSVFHNVINRYPDIVAFFRTFSRHRYDSELADFQNHYSEQYFKLKRYISVDQILS